MLNHDIAMETHPPRVMASVHSSNRGHGQHRTRRAADNALGHAAAQRINDSMPAFSCHDDHVHISSNVDYRRRNVAFAPQLFPDACLSFRAIELRQHAAIHMKDHDLDGFVAKCLGSADGPNHGLLRIRLAVDRDQNPAQLNDPIN